MTQDEIQKVKDFIAGIEKSVFLMMMYKAEEKPMIVWKNLDFDKEHMDLVKKILQNSLK